jgi:hypothetical protein
MAGLVPEVTRTRFGVMATLYLCAYSLQISSRSSSRPKLWVYWDLRSFRARIQASRTQGGVSRSGSPISKWMMCLPLASSSWAFSMISMARKGFIPCTRSGTCVSGCVGFFIVYPLRSNRIDAPSEKLLEHIL